MPAGRSGFFETSLAPARSGDAVAGTRPDAITHARAEIGSGSSADVRTGAAPDTEP
ncbi:hypothetical protein LX81_03333 [Palleronia aestuarii]|uniref:Uncharacterized protein n=1 Tax=Palleronia aestuarii TaxID=568105 RepID=A0A2W7MYC2_9RHOB|nr:hypothetical protein LX81_03333 [Palleronia aestuarii]